MLLQRNRFYWAGTCLLFLVLGFELIVPAREQAQVPDEANHMLAGVRYWKYHDFGTNPEHPPLVKLVAALPILGVPGKPPEPTTQFFKAENFLSAIPFLYEHDADTVLLRARIAASAFTFVLGFLIFAAGYEMYGRAAALLALLLFVFEPNLLAHGSLITTDMGVSCFFFASVYTFYRYVKRPSLGRLAVSGVMVGLTLAAKHSGVLVGPVLILLAVVDAFLGEPHASRSEEPWSKKVLRFGVALPTIGLIGCAVLWAFYGFHYQARPGNLALVPSLSDYAQIAPPAWAKSFIPRLATWHILPEAYLYGIVDIVVAEKRDPSFLLGTDYATGQWFYFPVTFVIKSTLAFLLLVFLAPFFQAVRQREKRREALFLLVPALAYFSVSLMSKMNLGIRHILPVYPFFIILAAASTMALSSKRRWGIYVAAAAVLCHVVSSARGFPDYLSYANELWGGPSNTYRLLTDSNADWGQGLKSAKRYLDQHDIKDCWFAHYGWNVNPAYYHIPCKLLPQGLDRRFAQPLPAVPARIEGTILISGSEADGNYWGPGDLNPYQQFLRRKPDEMIAHSILVFHGTFDVPLLSAMTHMSTAEQFAGQHRLDQALAEAQTAVALAPLSAEGQVVLGNVLLAMKKTNEAQRAFTHALALAREDNHDFQIQRILHIPPEFSPR